MMGRETTKAHWAPQQRRALGQWDTGYGGSSCSLANACLFPTHMSQDSLMTSPEPVHRPPPSWWLCLKSQFRHLSWGTQGWEQRGPLCPRWCHCLDLLLCIADSGCDSLTILFEEGLIQSPHYPEDYSNMASCNWVFQAPKHYLVKVPLLGCGSPQNRLHGHHEGRGFYLMHLLLYSLYLEPSTWHTNLLINTWYQTGVFCPATTHTCH